ncbi:prolyl 4-hydroxylase subunit alpha-2 isoform X2 [Manduca sexta]|uniref:prolyl 4-hydroxylase subunit alpha-2 isoform X2 n=1 Tax=Manduca sexta TaxID=7130 RepID=UPI001181CB92|nr:prolyl 4-hydroxylase subunit alpha-2 isoform X2 [Manduca sexta]
MRSLRVFCLTLLLEVCMWTRAELFTAISDVEPLLETHKRIIDDLDFYIQKEQKRLMILKQHLDLYKEEHERAMEDIPNYLGNPINAFTLIKRLTTDLDLIEDSIKIGTEYIKNITINHEDVKYPTLEDLTGAAQALTRLQVTYNLNVRDLSEGMLNGVSYSDRTSMTASDCYELGRALYNEKDYENSLSWMKEALRKYKNENKRYQFTEADILEYIGFSYYLKGDAKTAIEWTKKLLAIDPKHPRAKGNIPHYQKALADQAADLKKKQRGDTGEETQDEERKKKLSAYEKERRTYEALCRGEMVIPQEIAKRLKCWYLTENHPFLKLAPIKVEQSYITPDVFIFHEVLSDSEIEHIKAMAKPRFKRAVVHDPRTGELVPAHYRIGKSAWLRDDEADVIARVSRRVSDMTGLSMDFAEELQVVNYGIGGHYEPHYDFARKEHAFDKVSGNRIATVLFYMSEVAQGGATVFTELGLSLFPVKRAAAFWLNLHPSGEGDLATRHAACPVLRGSKWVSNKWIHQGGQELLKPCNLEYQEEGIVRKIPRPIPKSSR